MPCEFQYQLIEFIQRDIDAVLDAPGSFTKSQLLDLINHWDYSLSCILMYDYYVRDHNKEFFRQVRRIQKQ